MSSPLLIGSYLMPDGLSDVAVYDNPRGGLRPIWRGRRRSGWVPKLAREEAA